MGGRGAVVVGEAGPGVEYWRARALVQLLAWCAGIAIALPLLGSRLSGARLGAVALLLLLLQVSAQLVVVCFSAKQRQRWQWVGAVLASGMGALVLALTPTRDAPPLLAMVSGALGILLLQALYVLQNGRTTGRRRALIRPTVLEDAAACARAVLDRPSVELDQSRIVTAIAGRRVLVTGAGGSIGGELARQLLRFEPSSLWIVDRCENALFEIERKLLEGAHLGTIEPRIVDVRDREAVARLFAAARPDAVFHAAAHKHVPLMERHPAEAVLNNVLGTRVLSEAAHRSNVESFVFISTDKAVNPSSVMGATKRLGELYVQGMGRRSSTRFVAVRFGNVLGSSGSVVPIFMDQIRRGGPVTVTHPEMHRYFMSIPEACRLVLQAAAIGMGGEVLLLDMGPPVKILDLAVRLIERAGLRPHVDVPIVFSGLRPGEKLFEELAFAEEGATQTRYPGLWIGRIDPVELSELSVGIDALCRHAQVGDDPSVLLLLSQMVPGYRPDRIGEPLVAEVRMGQGLNAGGIST